MITWMIIAMAAFAGDMHAGIPVDASVLLGNTVFLEHGWSAPVLDGNGGNVAVYVGHGDQDARDWMLGRMRDRGTPALPIGAEESMGNGHNVAAFRDGNVAVVVERPGGRAQELATVLFEAIEDEVPWPQSPMVQVQGVHVSVDGLWANVAIRPAPSVEPGSLIPRPIRVIPTGSNAAVLGHETHRMTVVVWDRYGRTATQIWTQPVPQAANE